MVFTLLPHIDDSGFWVASRFLRLDVAGDLRTWAVLWAGFLGITIIFG
ncbi:hypothetical protein [Propionibacterium sp. oral taxon 192]|nr:hypothetical protein [Propionibacterium sp. oral taxon 192]